MVFGNAAFDNQAHSLRVQTALRSHRLGDAAQERFAGSVGASKRMPGNPPCLEACAGNGYGS